MINLRTRKLELKTWWSSHMGSLVEKWTMDHLIFLATDTTYPTLYNQGVIPSSSFICSNNEEEEMRSELGKYGGQQ